MHISSLYKNLALKIESVTLLERTLHIEISSLSKKCTCPYCGTKSVKVHSKYRRRLHDLPILNYQVVLVFTSRKFFCYNSLCIKKTFSEQSCVEIKRYARRTERLTNYLQSLFICCGSSRQVSRICKELNLKISPCSGLRLIYKAQLPKTDKIEVLGIDDWAYKKGCKYGSILVDLDKGKIIDLLPDRETTSFQNWLKEHTEVKIISRDRSSDYSAAIAITNKSNSIEEVADRFHLVKNIFDHVGKYIRKRYKELLGGGENQVFTNQKNLSREILAKVDLDSRQTLFKEVKNLQKQGYKITTVAKKLSIARQTVRKYFKYQNLPPIASKKRNKYYMIDELVHTNFSKGDSLSKIYKELKEKGFKGGRTPFYYHYQYLIKQKQAAETNNLQSIDLTSQPTISYIPPKIVTSMLIKHVTGTKLNHEDEKYFNNFCKVDWFKLLYQAVQAFYYIIMGNNADRLLTWMNETKLYDIDELKTFVRGLEMDYLAVQNAIKYDISNGMVEGFVNKLKTFKRDMYGRASFELLKRKLILSQLYTFN